MRLSRTVLPATAAFACTVLADVQFTSPAAGQDVSTGTITIQWTDSAVAPALTDLSTYTLQLMVGGNTDADSLPLTALVSQGDFSTGSTAQGSISAALAGPTKNGYYLKMTSTAKEGGTVINYSDRFNIPSMTGQTPPQFVKAAAAISGTKGPDTVNQVANNAAAPGVAVGGTGEYTVPYGLQTGLTKYAPMQSVPPTKITLKNFTPMHPTSAFTIATTWVAHPTIVTTMTASQTFSVHSMANTAAAQSQPAGDMAKFLARWKD